MLRPPGGGGNANEGPGGGASAGAMGDCASRSVGSCVAAAVRSSSVGVWSLASLGDPRSPVGKLAGRENTGVVDEVAPRGDGVDRGSADVPYAGDLAIGVGAADFAIGVGGAGDDEVKSPKSSSRLVVPNEPKSPKSPKSSVWGGVRGVGWRGGAESMVDGFDAFGAGVDGARLAKLLRSPNGEGEPAGFGGDTSVLVSPPAKPKLSATDLRRDVSDEGFDGRSNADSNVELERAGVRSNTLGAGVGLDAVGSRSNMLLIVADWVGDNEDSVELLAVAVIGGPASGLLVRGTGLLLR